MLSVVNDPDRSGVALKVDFARLDAHLAAAPKERPGLPLTSYGTRLALPDPTGAMVECFIAASPLMEPGLARKFPRMRTMIVQSADGMAAGRLELTHRGLTGMLRTPEGVWMIDLLEGRDPSLATSRWLSDVRAAAVEAGVAAGDWRCETLEGVHGQGTFAPAPPPAEHRYGDRGPVGEPGPAVTLRTVRLAVACSGEYGVHQSQLMGNAPNAADPLAAIVTNVSRANVVFEGDLALRLILIADNDRIVYFDPTTDPYPTTCDGTGGGDCSGPYLSPNISTLNSVIGASNFDIGHVLTRVFGGVAYLSSVCGNSKAGGVSGILRGGDVEALAFLVMVHELGHQFGASHTFSGTRGRCGNNATLPSAWEAGSGSSPMAYAGGCPVGDAPPSDNIAIFADPWFHHGSIEQMRGLLGNRSCPAQVDTSNHAPVVAGGPTSHAIPPLTPFSLSASASDSDGDAMVFSWEQFDAGVARPISGAGSLDNGSGALFRIHPPVSSAERTFPPLADVLAGGATPGEQLPSVAGTNRRFRVLVRDQHAGSGAGTISAPTTLTVAASAAPFALVSPPPPTVPEPSPTPVLGGGANTVEWTVGGSDAPPIGCTAVAIRLSTDDGATFPIDLGTFPNSGAASVLLPGGIAAARLRINAVGNVFFAVSARFTIDYCAGDFNRSGDVGVQDIFDFLMAYFAGQLEADVNASGGVTVQDIFDFLAAYFGACPS